MAGTDRRKPVPFRQGPVIILVEPQLGENIGAAARAMLNCGITELRLVSPRDGWPNPSAYVMASRADPVLDGVSVFKTTREAVADLHRVYASTARPREMMKEVLTPRAAAAQMRAEAGEGKRVGILFGRERTGLESDDLTFANQIISVPLNPGFSSLNLAQAVLLLGYEWFTATDTTPPLQEHTGPRGYASMEDLTGLFDHLETELDASGFFANIPDKRPAIVRNVRNIFQRVPMLEQDIKTLRGIVKALALGRPLRRRVGRKGNAIEPGQPPAISDAE